MSEITGDRTLRADARRSRAAVLDAAVQLLCDQPDASLEDVATAGGVSRQTVYAHFGGRTGLLAAVVAQATDDYIAALDGARLDEGPAGEALGRFVDVTTEWTRPIHRLPAALLEAAGDQDVDAAHLPVRARIMGLARRGQRSGDFARGLSPDWLATATVALGHALAGEVSAGRLSTRQGRQVLRRSLFRLYGVAAEQVGGRG